MDDVVMAMGYLCLGSRMKRIAERLQSDTQAIIDAEGFDVQASQYPLLLTLDRFGPASVGALSEALGVSQPGVTRMIAKLCETGWVRTEPQPQDQRKKTVDLTAQGRALIAASRARAWPQIEAAVRDLCASQSGSLLDQLAAIEVGLAERSLKQRAERLGEPLS